MPAAAASARWSDKLWLVACCAFTSMASMRICDAMLPAIGTQFGATPGQAARAISAFALAYGVLQLFYGPLGDRYGKVADPFGHEWGIATRVRDLSDAEMKQAADEWMAKAAAHA